MKTCLRKGRKHQRGRGENKSRSKEEVLHGRTGTLWMDMTVGLMLEHRTRVSRKEGQRHQIQTPSHASPKGRRVPCSSNKGGGRGAWSKA